MLDAISDLTAFQYSDFGRFLVCYSPPETVPETVKKPFLAIFLEFNLISTRLKSRRQHINVIIIIILLLLFFFGGGGLKTKQAGVALFQFGGDREGASECHRIVTLDRQ